MSGMQRKALPVAFALLIVALPERVRAGEPFRLSVPRGLDLYVPAPEDNRPDPAKIELGRKLFEDKRLSRDGSTSCSTCHQAEHRFTISERFAKGIGDQPTERNPAALINRAYGQSFFWDGRAGSLEAQALEPIQNPKEMDLTLPELERRLRQNDQYPRLFREAFGRKPNREDVGRALASFVRSLLSGDSPYDRYLLGDESALSPAAKRGFSLFQGKANCSTCHAGPNLTDERFHNTGVAWRDGRLQDVGRFAVTKQEPDRGAFKTPTLRDVALTAPYMHDGSLPTLEKVIDRYSNGGIKNPHLDEEIRPLNLSADEQRDLLAFLKSLTGNDVRR